MTEKKGACCANCGKWIEQTRYLTKRGYYTDYQSKYCSDSCRRESISKHLMGRKFSIQHRQRLSLTRKRLFAEGRIKPWNKGKERTIEERRKMSQNRRGVLGKKWANHAKRTIQYTPIIKLTEHNRDVLKLIPRLEKEGFVCVPTIKPLPDIIAFKEGKIIAIELEHGTPNLNKYKQEQSYYNQVVWIRDNFREIQELEREV